MASLLSFQLFHLFSNKPRCFNQPECALHGNFILRNDISAIGPLHDPVTWYKIKYTGEQVAQWDFQNKATRTNPP